MDKKSLEGKLRAIQELKAEKYVGTQEAWNYIQAVSDLYENPQKICDSINLDISKRGELFYPATPSRIIGISDFYNESCIIYDNERNIKGLENDEEEDDNEDEEDDDIEEYRDIDNHVLKNPLFYYKEFLIRNEYFDPDIELYKNYFMLIFNDLQYSEATNVNFINETIKKSLNDNPMSLEKELYLLKRLYNKDPDEILSDENLRNIERKIKREIYNSEIKIDKRIERMINDRVDHRLENRREILTDYISVVIENQDFLSKISLDSPIDYQMIVQELKETLIRRTNNLNQIEELKGPEYVVNLQKRLVEEAKFLLTVFAPERNFVKRFLEN